MLNYPAFFCVAQLCQSFLHYHCRKCAGMMITQSVEAGSKAIQEIVSQEYLTRLYFEFGIKSSTDLFIKKNSLFFHSSFICMDHFVVVWDRLKMLQINRSV